MKLQIAGCWLLGLVSVGWALLMSLACAMKTVPEMSWGEAATTAPLPIGTFLLASNVISQVRAGRTGSRSLIWWVLPVFLLGALALFIGAASYFGQP